MYMHSKQPVVSPEFEGRAGVLMNTHSIPAVKQSYTAERRWQPQSLNVRGENAI